MKVLGTVDRLEQDFLQTVYELADRKAKNAIAFSDVSTSLGRSDEETDQARDFGPTADGRMDASGTYLSYLPGVEESQHLTGL
jgi:hypothetical protein